MELTIKELRLKLNGPKNILTVIVIIAILVAITFALIFHNSGDGHAAKVLTNMFKSSLQSLYLR